MNKKENNLDLNILKDTTLDYSEILLDSFLKDGVFKEVPVVKTIVALGKTGLGIRDYLLANKLCAFMKNIQDIPQEKIDKFISKIDNPKKIIEIGMKIIQLLDKLDETKKAELVGKLYKLLINKEITISEYFRVCHLIDKCFYNDILKLNYFKTNESITSHNLEVPAETLEELFASGFISNHGFDGGTFEGNNSGTIYKLNTYGKIIINLI